MPLCARMCRVPSTRCSFQDCEIKASRWGCREVWRNRWWQLSLIWSFCFVSWVTAIGARKLPESIAAYSCNMTDTFYNACHFAGVVTAITMSSTCRPEPQLGDDVESGAVTGCWFWQIQVESEWPAVFRSSHQISNQFLAQSQRDFHGHADCVDAVAGGQPCGCPPRPPRTGTPAKPCLVQKMLQTEMRWRNSSIQRRLGTSQIPRLPGDKK